MPRIMVIDHRLFCNGVTLDLARRPRMLRLFKIFCEARNRELSRSDLLTQIYEIGEPERRTDRFKEATYANAVKLISRARILVSASLGRVAEGVDWLVFDQENKVWRLCQLKGRYRSEALN